MITSALSSISLINSPLSMSSGKVTNPIKPSAEEEFLEIARMSPAERLRMQILESMGMSEDSVASMDPEARDAIEDEISRRMMQALTGKDDAEPGSLVDMMA
ncbi:hypothetical protein [Devosia sp.]|uniref:hypothetical protein n=1 Tax=Devosia sp. TaxID=1871048 RepID=UPI0025D834C8|nr:hypothetical protein [Devosia sp.]MCR6636059.1 hypothetical protein [Devosia sp.]